MLGIRPAGFSLSWQRRKVIGALTIVFLVLLYFWQIGSMTSGLGPSELSTIQASHSLHGLYANPINAPHNVFDWALIKSHHLRPVYARAVSAIFALTFIGCFYRVAASWFGPLVGWLTSLLLATTPLVLIAGRNASADIMYLSPLAVGAAYFWISRSAEPSKIKLVVFAAILGLYLYTPGALYLILLGIFTARAALIKIIRSYAKWFAGLNLLLIAAIITPLVPALIHSPHNLRTLLLVPGQTNLVSLASQVGWMTAGLVWQTGQHYDLQVGRLAVLSIVQFILLIFGLYAFWAKARSKIYGLAALIVIAVIGTAFVGQFSFMLTAIATAGILAGAGLRYLLIEWQGVFPRNPLPRALALILLVGAVGMTMSFGIRYGLDAWPHTVATRQLYVLKYQ